jgi:hypothetical protein
LEGALGNASDCIRVDGTSGVCPTFIDQETPGGAVDGANVSFTIANAPQPAASLHLFRNGLLQRLGTDFTLSGATITFLTASTPQAGDTILASYRR